MQNKKQKKSPARVNQIEKASSKCGKYIIIKNVAQQFKNQL